MRKISKILIVTLGSHGAIVPSHSSSRPSVGQLRRDVPSSSTSIQTRDRSGAILPSCSTSRSSAKIDSVLVLINALRHPVVRPLPHRIDGIQTTRKGLFCACQRHVLVIVSVSRALAPTRTYILVAETDLWRYVRICSIVR